MQKVLTALFLALATPLTAQTCAPSISVVLAMDRHGESVVEEEMRPAANGDGLVQWRMWLNEGTGSWTLTGTLGAITCIFAAARSGYAGQTLADFLDGSAI